MSLKLEYGSHLSHFGGWGVFKKILCRFLDILIVKLDKNSHPKSQVLSILLRNMPEKHGQHAFGDHSNQGKRRLRVKNIEVL